MRQPRACSYSATSRFLRVDDTIGSNKLWHRLLKPGFSHEFASFFQTYAIRTTKASVKDELTIPQQTRYLVPIELGKVERHVYDQTLEQILLELGLDSRGVAATEGWEVDANLLRSSIRRLRGICTHPQVCGRHRSSSAVLMIIYAYDRSASCKGMEKTTKEGP